MTAIELLEWFKDHHAKDLTKIFGSKSICVFTKDLSAQEILDRIEKYEAEKNVTGKNVGYIEPEFKVGDWVSCEGVKYEIMQEYIYDDRLYLTVCNPKTNGITNLLSTQVEHAEPPKEEEQKIEPLPPFKENDVFYTIDCYQEMIGAKINQLVDAVNELRG